MKKGRQHIAFLLLAVYSLSMMLMASPSISFAGMDMKKRCPNKEKIQLNSDYMSSSGSASVQSEDTRQGSDNAVSVEICTSSSSFIIPQDEVKTSQPYITGNPQGRPHIYQAPDLLKSIDPPRIA